MMLISISMSDETTTNILFLLIAFGIFWFAIRATNAHFRAKEGKRRQEELDADDKRARKTVKTLLSTASEAGENSVPTKDLTEMYRTALGTQTSQDDHSVSKKILEALIKALSSLLKP